MKSLINLGVADPLTLGMAHPIAERLERLGRARPMSKLSRITAFGIIGTAAMLTAPITIAGETSEIGNIHSGEAASADMNHSLELWLVPDREAIYMEELQRRLDAVRAGTEDQTYVTDWKGDGTGTLMENHIYIYVSGAFDEISIETTDATGKRIPRTISTEVIAAAEPALMKCVDQTSVSKLPLTFLTSLKAVPEYALAGPHRVRCTPGNAAVRAAITNEQELEGLRQSPDIKEERRRAMMRGVKIRGLREAFEKQYPNPTREQKYENCISRKMILDRDYLFLGHEPKTDAEIKANCDEIDARENQ